MSQRFATSATALALTALAIAAALMTGAPAQAGSSPPWEPDAGSVGGLTFYDSSGNVITGGSINAAPLAAYVVGQNEIRSGDTKATLFGYLPKSGQAPGQWSGEQLSLSTTYPNAAAPGALASSALPTVTGNAGDESIATLAAHYQNKDTSSDGYAGMYQLRLRTSAPGQSPTTSYDSADILISGSTWSVVYSGIPPTGTVALSGPHRVGQVDTCTKSISNANSYAYSWWANGAQVPNAASATYKIAEKYYKQTLRCRVVATGDHGQATITSSGHTVGVGVALIATTKPYLYRGTNRTSALHGVYEYVNHGVWKPTATSYSYQWYVGSTKITGATGSRYLPTKSQIGKKLYCRVTAKRVAWTNGVLTTAGVVVK